MSNNRLNIPTYQAREFTWSGDTGITDISDLMRGAIPSLYSRVWNDACDMGFYVQGKNEVKLFLLTSEEHESFSMFFVSQCGKFKIRVFND